MSGDCFGAGQGAGRQGLGGGAGAHAHGHRWLRESLGRRAAAPPDDAPPRWAGQRQDALRAAAVAERHAAGRNHVREPERQTSLLGGMDPLLAVQVRVADPMARQGTGAVTAVCHQRGLGREAATLEPGQQADRVLDVRVDRHELLMPGVGRQRPGVVVLGVAELAEHVDAEERPLPRRLQAYPAEQLWSCDQTSMAIGCRQIARGLRSTGSPGAGRGERTGLGSAAGGFRTTSGASSSRRGPCPRASGGPEGASSSAAAAPRRSCHRRTRPCRRRPRRSSRLPRRRRLALPCP